MRTNKIIYFDGRPAVYQDCLGVLFTAGVDLGRSVAMLDSCQVVPEDQARFFFKKLLSAITGGAKKAVQGVEKADEHLGKAVGGVTGGGDEDCEWMTISGPKGTTHICIGHDGSIAKGPKGMKGKDAKATLDKGSHDGIDKAQAKAKEKHAKLHHLEKSAGNKIAEWSDRVLDTLELVSDLGPDSVGGAVGKIVGEKLGPVKKKSNKIKAGLREKYGHAGATAIQIAGIGLHQGVSRVADAIVPGSGLALGAMPLGKEAGALVVAAGVDQVHGLHKECKALGSAIKAAIKHVMTGGVSEAKATPAERAADRKKKKKRSKSAAMSAFGDQGVAKEPRKKADEDDELGGLSMAQVKKLGKAWWEEHQKACLEEIFDDPRWKDVVERHKAGSGKKKSKNKKSRTKTS